MNTCLVNVFCLLGYSNVGFLIYTLWTLIYVIIWSVSNDNKYIVQDGGGTIDVEEITEIHLRLYPHWIRRLQKFIFLEGSILEGLYPIMCGEWWLGHFVPTNHYKAMHHVLLHQRLFIPFLYFHNQENLELSWDHHTSIL